jgi:1,4-alpha-glucan branching enzyme
MAKKNNKSERTPGSNGREQDFSFKAPAARSVQLAGDFTDWQKKAISMQKAADGTWRAKVELAPGAHQYRFLVDGEWRDDPECHMHIANPYGSQDAVRHVA